MARRKVIALLMNDAGLGDYYQGELRRGAERVCRQRDVTLWVYGGRVDWTPSGSIQRQVFDLVDPRRVDGIVIASGCIASYAPIDDVLQRLRERCPVPICAVGGYCPGVQSLLIDNQSGARSIVDHLVKVHGRTRIAYIAGPPGHEESEQRLEGTRTALARYGLDLRPEALRHGNFALFRGRELVQEWLEAKLPFDAVIAANDEMATGALEALRAAGLDCPGQVSIAGFDDSANARFSQPTLTTVRQPITALGAAAVNHLIEIWEGSGAGEHAALETDLVVRESCGCHVSGEDAGPASERSQASALVELLTPVLDTQSQREGWATLLLAAVDSEMAGTPGALAEAFRALLAELTLPSVHVEELQRTITALRTRAIASGKVAPEGAFHAARALVSAHASRIVGERNLRASWLLRELRRGSERLATALSLNVLKEALNTQFPQIGIKNALVALYAPGTLGRLEPLVCLEDGVPAEGLEASYPAELLLPPSREILARCSSLTILPLTFQLEQLGVMVLEIPLRLELYAILREQIGNAIKTVQLHQEVLAKQRLHAQAQEEKRATTERLKSLGVIAGGVAHDLNNVLGPLLALPQSIQHELERSAVAGVPPEVLEDLETIEAAGQRAASTIHDLLALGRVDEIAKTPIDLNDLLSRERRMFSEICRSSPKVSVRIDLGPGQLPVHGSKPHLLRAISNLVINAAQAISGEGSICVRTSLVHLSERLEGQESVEPGDYAVVEVADTGAGIPSERLAQIFEPFFSARRGGPPGTGLGLAIVRRIVKDCAGYVQVRSEAGTGTRFSLFFPLLGEQVLPERRQVQAVQGGSERILVVDDESLQLRVARRILAKLGYTVVTSTSGDAALELYLQTGERELFDLVIVDMMMPGNLNGIATIEEMRKVRPAQKALVATGFSPERMDRLTNAQGLAWLPKPYTLNALSDAVRSVLNGTK